MSHDGQLLDVWLNDKEGIGLVEAIHDRKEKA